MAERLEILIQANIEQTQRVLQQLRADISRFSRDASGALRESARASQELAGALGSIKTAAAALAGVWVAVRSGAAALETVVAAARAGVQAVEDFRQRTIQVAAALVSLDRSTGPQNIAERFREAMGYAEGIYGQLQRIDAQFSGTIDDLLQITQQFIQHGVLLDLNNQKQAEALRGFAEAVRTYSAGLNVSLEAARAIRALLTGQRDDMNQVVRAIGLAGQAGDELRRRLAGARDATERTAILMDALRERTRGFVVAGDAMQRTLGAAMSTLQGTLAIIGREVAAPLWEAMASAVSRISDALRDSSGSLTGLGAQLVTVLRPAAERVGAAIRGFVDHLIAHGPEIVRLLGEMAQRMAALADGALAVVRVFIGLASWVGRLLDWFRERGRGLHPSWDIHMAMTQQTAFERSAREAARAVRTIEPAAAPRFDLRGITQEARSVNTELQRQLALHELNTLRHRWSVEQQIADLVRIRNVYTRTADERLQLDIRIERLRQQLAEQTRRAQVQASLDFIEAKKRANEMSLEDEIRALERVLAHHRLNADERRAIELRLVEARSRLRRQELEEAQKLAQQIAEAETRARIQEVQVRGPLEARGPGMRPEDRRRAAEEVLRIVDQERAARLERIELEVQLGLATRERLMAELEAQARALEGEGRINEALRLRLRLQQEEQRARLQAVEQQIAVADAQAQLEGRVLEQQITARRSLLEVLPQTVEFEARRLDILRQIADLERQMAEQRARQDLLAAWKYVLDQLKRQATDWIRTWQNLIQGLEDAFAELFRDILSGARSFGEALSNFFRSVVNAIINEIARLAARWIVRQILLPVLGLARGGVVAGGLMPAAALAMQAGGIVTRPTLALIGEGRQAEAVVPLPDNRSIPVRWVGDSPGRPVEVRIANYVVLDPAQIRPSPDEIVNVVTSDMLQGGRTMRVVRALAR